MYRPSMPGSVVALLACAPCAAQSWFSAESRYHHAVAGGATPVMFGGTPDGLTALGDTVLGGGGGWVQVRAAANPPFGPPPLVYHDMALHVSATDAIARAVLYGGREPGVSQPNGRTWVWNGIGWEHGETPAALTARERHAMVFDPGRRVTVLFGGLDVFALARNDTWEWNGAVWNQVNTPTRPPGRWGHALAYDEVAGRVVLFGGNGGRSDTWTYDGTNWTLQVTAPEDTPGERIHHAMAFDPISREVVLCGGEDRGATRRGDTWTFDRSGPRWVQRGALFGSRSGHRLFVDQSLASPHLVLVGGLGSSGPDTATLRWNGTTWLPTTVPAGRPDMAMAFDAVRSVTVLFGGSMACGFGAARDDMWLWDGLRWTGLAPTPRPPARAQGAMTFDAARARIVLFGGAGPAGLSDTWEWDGTRWSQAAPTSSPPPLIGASLDYDVVRRRSILFGGSRSTTATMATQEHWEWDGTNWASQSPSPRPRARFLHAAAFDAARGRLVVHGGEGAAPGISAETWEWDGTVWRDVSPPAPAVSPRGRHGHSMAYDSRRRVCVLFGGWSSAGGELNDLWEWDGTQWHQRAQQAGNQPRRRLRHRMVYDVDRGRGVLFGGMVQPDDGDRCVHDDTWEWGPDGGFDPAGSGCPGPSGTPQLTAVGLPVIGTTCQLRFVALQGPTLLLVGLSDVFWNVRLPLDLTPLGAPGCVLYQSIDLVVPVPFAGGGSLPFTLAADPALIGQRLYQQCACLVPGFNPLGLVFSNQLRLRIAGP